MADNGDADDLGLPGFEQETSAAAQARLARLQSACNGSMKPEARFSHLTDAGGGPMQYDLTLDTQAAPGDAQISTPLTEPRFRWTAPKLLDDGLSQSALEQQAVQARLATFRCPSVRICTSHCVHAHEGTHMHMCLLHGQWGRGLTLHICSCECTDGS